MALEILTDLLLDGFFDAGMLLQALKARGENLDNGETKNSERAAVQARRRDVGKKLRYILPPYKQTNKPQETGTETQTQTNQ